MFFIFTANTDPFGFTQGGVVENDSFSYRAFHANGFRGYRIELGRADQEVARARFQR